MARAWEATHEDLEVILAMHAIRVPWNHIERIHSLLDNDAIEEAVLAYSNFDEQVEAANSEIEDQLIAKGIVTNAKCFFARNHSDG